MNDRDSRTRRRCTGRYVEGSRDHWIRNQTANVKTVPAICNKLAIIYIKLTIKLMIEHNGAYTNT